MIHHLPLPPAQRHARNGARYPNLYQRLLANTQEQAHIALWVWLQAEPAGIDEFYLQYHTLTSSGLQLDHLCVTATCVCPDHIDLCTPQENMRRRDDRRRQRAYFYQEAA